MMEVTEMKKISIGALLVALAVVMAGPAQAAFTVGGENGWQLSTDGIVNIFAAYQAESGNNNAAFLFGPDSTQKFGVRVGLLPSIIAFNIKAPTTAGIDSNVRAAMYVNVQNNSGGGDLPGWFTGPVANSHYNTNPNIDFREFYYTAKGNFGEFLAGRALNLFQGQNILNDMTLFTAGVVDMQAVRGGTSLGHIGYGYLYANFGPQFRYTTPDMGGFKVAFEVGEPYAISGASAKQDVPRLETEFSYATAFKGGSVHAWLEGIEQTDTRVNAGARPGGHNISLGVAPGINVQFGPVGIMGSGYFGTGLGMVSTQDGAIFSNGNGFNGVDLAGNQRTNWGFLGQATFQATDAIRLAVNYGANHQDKTDFESNILGDPNIMKCQEAAVAQVNYNLNKFTQFTLEYIWAQNTTQGGDRMQSNQVALGTVFFW